MLVVCCLLFDAYWLLVIGRWLLVICHWLLVGGCWFLLLTWSARGEELGCWVLVVSFVVEFELFDIVEFQIVCASDVLYIVC